MHRENHRMNGGPSAPETTRPVRRHAANIAALALAVLLIVFFVPAPVAAADESATFKADRNPRLLASRAALDGRDCPPHRQDHPRRERRLHRVHHAKPGTGGVGRIPPTTPPTDDCAGQKVQHFKFSWQFNKDVSTVSGKQGDNLFIINTKWEGDTGNKCLDENPCVWNPSGGPGGKDPMRLSPARRSRWRSSTKSERTGTTSTDRGRSSPTVSFNSINYENGGFMFTPSIRFLDAQLDIVYAYDKVRAPQPRLRPRRRRRRSQQQRPHHLRRRRRAQS